jgi:hypothetical protein
MQTNATAKHLREKRSETRNHVKEYYNVGLSVDGLNHAYKFKIWDRTTTSISFLVKKHVDILPRLKVGDTLHMTYYPTDSSYPQVRLVTIIQHITESEQRGSKGHYLVGLKISEEQILREG